MENKLQKQLLLKKVGVINFKHKKLKNKDRFNLFSVLLKEHDEVNLHSRFLAEILNPKGSHGKGSVFLDLFLKEIKLPGFSLVGAVVKREFQNIDLLIMNKQQAIIIENKIYAEDQPKQLERYYLAAKSYGINDITIIYLTLDGKDPSDQSLGIIKDIPDYTSFCINHAYSETIDRWLEKCIKESALEPAIRESLLQYKKLLNKLTGNTMNDEQKAEILELISEGDNIINAQSIVSNWKHVRWHTEWDFWISLEQTIEKEYKIENRNKYSPDNLNSVIHQARGKNPHYGLMFQAGSYKGFRIFLYIERANKLFYGLTAINDEGVRTINLNPELDELAKSVGSYSDPNSRNEWWIDSIYPENPIDFNLFSDKTTLMLANKEEREKYVQQLWSEIKAYIAKAPFEKILPLNPAHRTIVNESSLEIS